MKKIIPLLLLMMLGCGPEDTTPTQPIDDDFDPMEATLVRQGNIMGVGHTVMGVASIYEMDGAYTVVLDPFSSQNGPDLKVYLSKDVTASAYLRLGNLKSTMGKQSYDIPASTAIDEYDYVHIWCEQFSVEFARAEVK